MAVLLFVLILGCLLPQPVHVSGLTYSVSLEAQNASPQAEGRNITIGLERIIVIPVGFSDRKHEAYVGIGAFRSMIILMNNYYREVSYGMLEVKGDVLPKWYAIKTPLSKLGYDRLGGYHKRFTAQRLEEEIVHWRDLNKGWNS
jgi:hypothetical protein